MACTGHCPSSRFDNRNTAFRMLGLSLSAGKIINLRVIDHLGEHSL
jgi:hypothetical protein